MSAGPILLTGATGFVGGHVMSRGRELGLPIVASSGDLRDPQVAHDVVADANPSAVIHLAACPRAAGLAVWDLLADEVRMAGNLLRALDDVAPGARVLIPGSAGQYGIASGEPLSETAPTVPLSAYGAVKCALETACLTPALRGRSTVIWARSFNLLGPGQGLDAPVPSWARQIAEGESEGGVQLRTGDLSVVRDFLDVRDVADAYLALLQSDVEGVVNVGSGLPVTLQDIVDLLAANATAPVDVESDASLRRPLDPAVRRRRREPVAIGDGLAPALHAAGERRRRARGVAHDGGCTAARSGGRLTCVR